MPVIVYRGHNILQATDRLAVLVVKTLYFTEQKSGHSKYIIFRVFQQRNALLRCVKGG